MRWKSGFRHKVAGSEGECEESPHPRGLLRFMVFVTEATLASGARDVVGVVLGRAKTILHGSLEPGCDPGFDPLQPPFRALRDFSGLSG